MLDQGSLSHQPAAELTPMQPQASSAARPSLAEAGETTRPPRRLEIVVSDDAQGEVCIRLSGELDLGTVPALDRVLGEIAHTKLDRVLIDLRPVEFMDSAGLAAIMRAQRSAQATGHTLALRRGSRQVQRLIALTGLSDRLTFED